LCGGTVSSEETGMSAGKPFPRQDAGPLSREILRAQILWAPGVLENPIGRALRPLGLEYRPKRGSG
jgi:hypothetical protein